MSRWDKGISAAGAYVYKTLGPWRTPKWVWPYRIERERVGPRRGALLMVYRELWRDQCVSPGNHNGLPLQRGHLMGSLKAPSLPGRRNAHWWAKFWQTAGCRQCVSSYGFLRTLRGALSHIGGKGGKRQFPPVLLGAHSCGVTPLGVSGGGMKNDPPPSRIGSPRRKVRLLQQQHVTTHKRF